MIKNGAEFLLGINDAEDMGSRADLGCVNRSTGAEVDLSLFPWLTFKAPEGKFLPGSRRRTKRRTV